MRPRTKDTRAQESLIARAAEVLAGDDRIIAAWLEGSFASGTADPWSDVDLHIAVRDEDWEGVFADRLSLLGRIAPVIGHGEAPLPWGARRVAPVLEFRRQEGVCDVVSRSAVPG